MNHSPLPFKTLGPLLGLLAVVVGLSLANLSYLNNNNNNLTADVVVIAPSTVTFNTFDLRFSTTTYPYQPSLHWVITGPASIPSPQNNMCTLSDGAIHGQPVTVYLNPNPRYPNRDIYSPVFGNTNQKRTMTMTCSGSNSNPFPAPFTLYRSLFYPPVESITNGDFGASSLINSFSITPAGRPVGSTGSLAWQAVSGSICTLKKGNSAKTVSPNSFNETSSYLTVTTTNPAVTYTLTCVTNNSRSTRVITDTPSITGGSNGGTTSSGGSAITTFTATPSTAHTGESVALGWTTTGMKTCSLSGNYVSSFSNSRTYLNSSSAPLVNRTVVRPASVPIYSYPDQYTLSCFGNDNILYNKTVSITYLTTTTPPPPPPATPSTSAPGVHPIMPGSDSYATYNISSVSTDQNKARVRISQDVPNFTTSPNLALANQANNWLAWIFGGEASAAPTVNSVDIFKDGVANYNSRPTLKVPYWTKVKFQWRFAQRTQNDATLDPARPTNLPGGTWCGYVDSVKQTCAAQNPNTQSAAYNDCLHRRIAWPPQAIAFDNYNTATKQYTNWNLLYDGGFTSCQDQYSSGEWEWTPIPGDSTKTLLQVSQIWGPNGNTPTNMNPVWLPQVSDAGPQKYVSVQAYKCEKPFDDITKGFNNYQKVDVTESSFKDWANGDGFDSFAYDRWNGATSPRCLNKADPTQCNSGDLNDIKAYMSQRQCTAISQLDLPKLVSNLTVISYVGKYLNAGYPIPLYYIKVAILPSGSVQLAGNHAVIGLKFTTQNSGKYSFDILDSNGPKIDNISCETKQIQFSPGVFTSTLVCESALYPNQVIILASPGAVQSPISIDTLIANRARGDVANWLKSNYPNITNFTGTGEEATNGVCAGWSEFMLKTAYLARFVGECPRP